MPDQRMTGLFGLSPSTADVRDILSTIPVRKGGVLPLTEYGDGTSRLDWTAGIPGSLWDAFTAPARAYRGEIPEDQMIPEGLNFAGSVALGSAAVPRGRVAAAPDRYRPVPAAEDVSYTYPAIPTRGGFTDEPLVNPFPGHARAVMDAETGGMMWPFDLTERATQRASGARAAPDLWSNPKESSLPGTVLSSASHLDMSPEATPTVRAYHGASSSYEGDIYNPRRSQYRAFFAAESPELANNFARSYGDAPRVYPVDMELKKTFDASNPAHGDAIVNAFDKGGLFDRNYLMGSDTIRTMLRNGDAGLMEDPGVRRWLQRRGYDSWKFEDTAAPPGIDNRTSYGVLKPGRVRDLAGNVLFSNPETSAAPGLGLMAAAKQEPKGFIAYHGSPHDFDRFDISKIGTGEGAQAYGHGLYAADSPAVADSYRGAGNRGEWNYDPSIKRTLAEQEALSWLGSPAAQGTTNIRDLPQLARFGREPDLPWIKALDDLIARGEISRPGRLYQVRINADPDHFLDWDKPLSQQSEVVKGALENVRQGQSNGDRKRVGEAYSTPNNSGGGEPAPESISAGDFYKSVSRSLVNGDWGDPGDFARQLASQRLRDAGIPGIKYLDQGSRAAGDGSRNYVVFDDKLIDILKKYGLFGSLGMGAASMMSGGEANAAPAPKASPLWALQPGVF